MTLGTGGVGVWTLALTDRSCAAGRVLITLVAAGGASSPQQENIPYETTAATTFQFAIADGFRNRCASAFAAIARQNAPPRTP